MWFSSFPLILERVESGRVPSALAARAYHLPPRMAGAGRLSPAQSSAAATRPTRVQPAGRARGTPGLVVLRRRAGRGSEGWGHQEAERSGREGAGRGPFESRGRPLQQLKTSRELGERNIPRESFKLGVFRPIPLLPGLTGSRPVELLKLGLGCNDK